MNKITAPSQKQLTEVLEPVTKNSENLKPVAKFTEDSDIPFKDQFVDQFMDDSSSDSAGSL